VPAYVLSHKAYLSLLLHAAKHPHKSVNGVLLGKSTGADIVDVVTTVPLLHAWTSLSPMMEIGLDLATSFAEDQGLQLVGYYQASHKLNESSFGPVGERMLANLRQSNPHALGLLIRLDELVNSDDAPALGSNPPASITLANPNSPARVRNLIGRDNLQLKFADFDDHLENVALDWLRNPECMDADWS